MRQPWSQSFSSTLRSAKWRPDSATPSALQRNAGQLIRFAGVRLEPTSAWSRFRYALHLVGTKDVLSPRQHLLRSQAFNLPFYWGVSILSLRLRVICWCVMAISRGHSRSFFPNCYGCCGRRALPRPSARRLESRSPTSPRICRSLASFCYV